MNSIERLVVDANPLLSAIIGGNASKIFILRKEIQFFTTEFTLKEVERYIPKFSNKWKISEDKLYLALITLPVVAYGEDFYRDEIKKAKELIEKRDPDDFHLLALALRLNYPIWTNDQDFKEIDVEVFTTSDLLKILNTNFFVK